MWNYLRSHALPASLLLCITAWVIAFSIPATDAYNLPASERTYDAALKVEREQAADECSEGDIKAAAFDTDTGDVHTSPPAVPRPPRAFVAAQRNEQAITVYITRTGEKYHRGSCQYLSRSKYAVSLTDAIRKGYAACKVCRPPR